VNRPLPSDHFHRALRVIVGHWLALVARIDHAADLDGYQ
jgi:hypothetical protein